MRTKMVIIGVLALMIGVVFELFALFGWNFGVLVLTIGLIAGVFQKAVGGSGYFLVAIVCCMFGVGIIRADLARMTFPESLEMSVNERVMLEGVVVREPDRRRNSTRLTLSVERQLIGDEWRVVDTPVKFIATFPRYVPFEYGDKLQVAGMLSKPENFVGENGREFNYVGFLAKDRIHYLMYRSHAEYISSGHGSAVRGVLYAAKRTFLARIGQVIPEPQASLLGGLLVGERRALGEETLDAFRAAGLVHVIVLSGYHVTIVADSIMRVLSFLPRVAGLALGAGGIVLFAMLTMGATVIRASSMALLVLFARATGRTTDTIRLLFLVGAAMILWNPLILLYDPSFQLSFTATLGLLMLSEKVKEWVAFIPETFNLRDIASATISTQILILPLLVYMMGDVSLVSVPANLLVIAFIPLTMLFGFFAGVFGLASVTLAYIPAFIANVLLSYTLWIVNFAAGLPVAAVTIPAFPTWALVLSYVFLGAWIFSRREELRVLRRKKIDTGKIGTWRY